MAWNAYGGYGREARSGQNFAFLGGKLGILEDIDVVWRA